MKKINIRGRLVVLALFPLFMGCDDFTTVNLPENQLTGTAVFQDPLSARTALLDTYARIRELGTLSGGTNGVNFLMGLYSDELVYYGFADSPMDAFWKHNLQPTNESVSSLWSNSYSQIYALNALKEGLDASTALSQEVVAQLKGEALFLRGFLHFNLAQLYGAVPYVTTTNYRANAVLGRVPEGEVLEQVIEDLGNAEALLPLDYPSNERVRVNKAAVQALLARIYLYQQDWTAAAEAATAVLANASIYQLNPDPATAFLKNNTSTIWQLHSGVTGTNTLQGRILIFETGPPPIASMQPDLVNSFETGDLRRLHWIKEVTNGSETWYQPAKYKANGNTGTTVEHSIVLRLEECHLIRAEANARLGLLEESRTDLNTIRTRAGLEAVDTNSQSLLLEHIAQERRREFFTEYGHRWFDLKRSGTADSVLAAVKPGWRITDLLLPLPESELLLNKNLQPQNPGY